MKGVLCAVIAAGALMLHDSSIDAHHSNAAWVHTRTVTFTGTICVVEWTNPHSHIYLYVKHDNGQTEMWATELPAVNRVAKAANIADVRDLLKAGDTITIEAYPSKTSSNPEPTPSLTFGRRCSEPGANALLRGAARELILPDGKHLTVLDVQ